MKPQIYGEAGYTQVIKALEIAGFGPETGRTEVRIHSGYHVIEIPGLTEQDFLSILEAGFQVLRDEDSKSVGGSDRYINCSELLGEIWRLQYPDNYGTVENWFVDHYPIWKMRWNSPKILHAIQRDFMGFASSND